MSPLTERLRHHVSGAIARGEGKAITEIPAKYRKVRFTSKRGATAGLVIESGRLARMNVADLSRLFPYSESRFMAKVETSPEYATWDDAFAHSFD